MTVAVRAAGFGVKRYLGAMLTQHRCVRKFLRGRWSYWTFAAGCGPDGWVRGWTKPPRAISCFDREEWK